MFYLVKDDVGTQIKATLTREDDGSAVDLTSATAVVMRFRAKDTTTVLATLNNLSGADDQANGICYFVFSSGDLNVTEGKYEGEIECRFSNGNIETVYEIIEFYVRGDFDQ